MIFGAVLVNRCRSVFSAEGQLVNCTIAQDAFFGALVEVGGEFLWVPSFPEGQQGEESLLGLHLQPGFHLPRYILSEMNIKVLERPHLSYLFSIDHQTGICQVLVFPVDEVLCSKICNPLGSSQ